MITNSTQLCTIYVWSKLSYYILNSIDYIKIQNFDSVVDWPTSKGNDQRKIITAPS